MLFKIVLSYLSVFRGKHTGGLLGVTEGQGKNNANNFIIIIVVFSSPIRI